MFQNLQESKKLEENKFVDLKLLRKIIEEKENSRLKEIKEFKELLNSKVKEIKKNYQNKPILIFDSFSGEIFSQALPAEIYYSPVKEDLRIEVPKNSPKEKLPIEISKNSNISGFYLSCEDNFQFEEFINIFEINYPEKLNNYQNLLKLPVNSKLKLSYQSVFFEDKNLLQTQVLAKNSLNKILLAKSAQLEFNLFQSKKNLYDFNYSFFEQSENSNLLLNVLYGGNAFLYNQIFTKILGSKAKFQINGLQIAKEKNSLHNQIYLEHKSSSVGSKSSQKFKSILLGRSKAEFTGVIKIEPKAIKSDATQVSKSLVLSNKAEMHTRPCLDIGADDVKCSHGATVSQISDQQTFYLQSRGISKKIAQKLLILGFAKEITEKLGDLNFKEKVLKQITSIL